MARLAMVAREMSEARSRLIRRRDQVLPLISPRKGESACAERRTRILVELPAFERRFLPGRFTAGRNLNGPQCVSADRKAAARTDTHVCPSCGRDPSDARRRVPSGAPRRSRRGRPLWPIDAASRPDVAVSGRRRRRTTPGLGSVAVHWNVTSFSVPASFHVSCTDYL